MSNNTDMDLILGLFIDNENYQNSDSYENESEVCDEGYDYSPEPYETNYEIIDYSTNYNEGDCYDESYNDYDGDYYGEYNSDDGY